MRRPVPLRSALDIRIRWRACLCLFAVALGAIILLTRPLSIVGASPGAEWEARQVYLEDCAGCHGFDRMGFVGVALDPAALEVLSEAAIRSLIKNGVYDTLMPPWDCRLTLVQLHDLAHYLKGAPVETEEEIRMGPDGRLVVAPAPSAWWQDQKRIERGRSLFMEYCMGCHHPEYDAFAPAYSVVAGKRNIREVVGQIKFPFRSSRILGYEDQTMPKFELTDREIRDLGAYVSSHRGKAQDERDTEN